MGKFRSWITARGTSLRALIADGFEDAGTNDCWGVGWVPAVEQMGELRLEAELDRSTAETPPVVEARATIS